LTRLWTQDCGDTRSCYDLEKGLSFTENRELMHCECAVTD